MRILIEVYKEIDKDGFEYYVAESKDAGIKEVGMTPRRALEKFAFYFEFNETLKRIEK